MAFREQPAISTFLYVDGVKPTNSTAERAVRHGVLCRKPSYGMHSEDSSRFIERILSVQATLRQQQRNVLHFVQDACRAALDGTPSPSLLPVLVDSATTSRPAQLRRVGSCPVTTRVSSRINAALRIDLPRKAHRR